MDEWTKLTGTRPHRQQHCLSDGLHNWRARTTGTNDNARTDADPSFRTDNLTTLSRPAFSIDPNLMRQQSHRFSSTSHISHESDNQLRRRFHHSVHGAKTSHDGTCDFPKRPIPALNILLLNFPQLSTEVVCVIVYKFYRTL